MEDHRFLFLLSVACCCFAGASAMLFDVDGDAVKCFSEELNVKALSLGHYQVVSENPPYLSVTVSSPYGNIIYSQQHLIEGEFAFTANEAGGHTACFQVVEPARGRKVTIDLDWKTGIAAKDWASVAKRERIDGVELELRKLEDAVQLIHDNMIYLRAKEEEMRHVNEITNSRMAWFSISSIFVCLVVASLQIWHLRTFFERKKLL